MARLFVAVWPPEEIVAELMRLRRKDQRGVRFVRPDSWHVTLRFLGEARVDHAAVALDGVRFPPARARLGPAVDLLGDRALVIPVTGLDGLAAAVTEATQHLGQPTRARFTAHLTLARLKPYAQMPTTLGATIADEFEVEEVALVRSQLHPDGARYETIETWPTARD